jgi:hypothetical protein
MTYFAQKSNHDNEFFFKKLWNFSVAYWGVVPHYSFFCTQSNQWNFANRLDTDRYRIYFIYPYK